MLLCYSKNCQDSTPYPRLNNPRVLVNLKGFFEKRAPGFPGYAGPPSEIVNA